MRWVKHGKKVSDENGGYAAAVPCTYVLPKSLAEATTKDRGYYVRKAAFEKALRELELCMNSLDEEERAELVPACALAEEV